ncbi:hypothetical protein [Pandoraea norimbergensis]
MTDLDLLDLAAIATFSKKAPRSKHASTKNKLTQQQREEIVQRAKAGETQATLAKEYGVTPQAISKTIAKSSGKHIAKPDIGQWTVAYARGFLDGVAVASSDDAAKQRAIMRAAAALVE